MNSTSFGFHYMINFLTQQRISAIKSKSRMMVGVFMKLTMVVTMVVVLGYASATPLDDYVKAPDKHYNYTFLTSYQAPNARVHVLNMTSQKWLDERMSNRPVWWHYLVIIIPKQLNHTDTGFLYIAGGENGLNVPTLDDKFVSALYTLAVTTGTVTSVLKQIPNQPIVFKSDPSQKSRKEDATVSWTWKLFLENGSNPEVLLRLPMTKAAVRAMDTITAYCQKSVGKNISQYFVAGASKRGWTTWTTAAVDKRVIGMAPVVMDLLNSQKSLHHQFRSLGGWTMAFADYYNDNVTIYLDSVNFGRMAAVIDPISYKDRYSKMPKFIVTTTGDEFFLPDDSHYYFKELKGPTYLRLVPNAEHSMFGHVMNVLLSLRSFYMHILNSSPLPNLRWEMSQTDRGGKITLWTDREPSSAFMYYAYTLKDGRRDFRLMCLDRKTGEAAFHPVLWFKDDTRRISPTQYEAELDRPLQGWAAFFIQVTFDGMADGVLEFSTELNIIPDTFAFPDCKGTQCYGTLV